MNTTTNQPTINNTKGNQTMNTSINQYAEQRGTLTYMKPDYTFKTVEGWFYTNNGTVVMRKIRGRNHFCVCAESVVYDFTQHQ